MKIAALLALPLLVMVGCGSEENDPLPAPVVTEGVDKQQIGADYLQARNPNYSNISDESLIDLFNVICEAFDGGSSFEEVVEVGLSSGVTPSDMGSAVGVAIESTCPEHRDEVYNN